MKGQENVQLYPANKLQLFCKKLLIAAGVSLEDAVIVAEVLINTSLDGIDTHGINRLPIYVSNLLNRRINAQPKIKVFRNTSAVATIDGDNGLGQLVAVRSMEVGIKMAREVGIGAVAVRCSNHFGAASAYCKQAVKENMATMVFTNSPSAIPPWGGKKPYFGTNPVAFGFPTQGIPVIVELSSSNVARGKIIMAASEGRPIPEGWAIDEEGRPTTIAEAALKGAALPLGGAKGYALALAVEILSGVISGAAFGSQVGWMYDDKLDPVNIGHFFIVMDIERFMPLEHFLDRIEQMIRDIKDIPLADGFSGINIPGERKEYEARRRRVEGIPVNSNLLKEFNNLAGQLEVPELE